MKKILIAILFLILSTNLVKAAGKYQGSGELKLNDYDVEWFLQYLKAPAGQSPMLFWVLSENGKSIWAAYWYCPAGNCQVSMLANNAKICKEGAEKYYKKFIEEDCKIFARRRTIIWRNGINPGKGKTSQVKSKYSEEDLRAKLTELGFLGDAVSSNTSSSSNNTKTKSENNSSSTALSDKDLKKLKELKELFDDGILTEEEFQKAKNKILNK